MAGKAAGVRIIASAWSAVAGIVGSKPARTISTTNSGFPSLLRNNAGPSARSNGLPATLDPDATIAFGLDLSGTTNRPTGDWHLDFEGDLLRRRGYALAPARQKVAVSGTMKPEGNEVVVDNDLDFHVDAGGPATVAHHTHGTFARSPLLKGFMDKPLSLIHI